MTDTEKWLYCVVFILNQQFNINDNWIYSDMKKRKMSSNLRGYKPTIFGVFAWKMTMKLSNDYQNGYINFPSDLFIDSKAIQKCGQTNYFLFINFSIFCYLTLPLDYILEAGDLLFTSPHLFSNTSYELLCRLHGTKLSILCARNPQQTDLIYRKKAQLWSHDHPGW